MLIRNGVVKINQSYNGKLCNLKKNVVGSSLYVLPQKVSGIWLNEKASHRGIFIV